MSATFQFQKIEWRFIITARLSNNDQQAQIFLYTVIFLGSPQYLAVNIRNPDVLRAFFTLYVS
jgi:hypothetical protein